MYKSRKKLAFAASAFLALAACAGGPPPVYDTTNRAPVKVPVGTLTNADMRIVATDGSFTINGGQQFSPSFYVDLWSSSTAFQDANIIEGFRAARTAGAKDVKVYITGKSQPLYGVLALSTVWSAASGPGTRSYQISVPKDKIDNAYAGNTSVVYEDVAYKQTFSNGTANNYQFRSWVLWLSATPL